MKNIVRLIDTFSNYLAVVSAIFLFIIILLILSNILLMALFNKSILITAEYSGYMFAGLVMFSLGYSFKEKSHIRITFLFKKLPQKIQKVLYVITLAVAGAISFFIAYYSAIMVYKAYIYQMRADTVAQTLLWIPQSCLPIGFFVLGLQIICEIIKEFK